MAKAKIHHINHGLVAKSHPALYLMHKYWARKPHNVVAEYIKSYSKKGEIVLDPFCGSGVTVIEALRSGRKAVGIDLDPLSAFITECTAEPINLEKYISKFNAIKDNIKQKIDNLYITNCPLCNKKTISEAIIWENSLPKEIRYSCICNKYRASLWKEVEEEDLRFIKKVNKKKIPYWYPKNELIWNTRVNVHKGDKVVDLFTKRNLLTLSMILYEIEKIKDRKIRKFLKFTFSSALPQASKLVFVIRKRGRQKGEVKETKEVGSWATRGYWIPKEYFEINAWNCFEERFKKVSRGKQESNRELAFYYQAKNYNQLKNQSNVFIKKYNAIELDEIIPANSVDYIFTDPPYGDAIPYLELDLMWNSWLKFKFNLNDEIIISDSPLRNKKHEIYEKMLNAAFSQIFRVLKPGKYLTVTFHSTDIKIWTSIIKAVIISGFDLEKIIYQPPARPSAKGLLAPYASAVGDYYIRFKKPEKMKKMTKEEITKDKYERIVVGCAKKILAQRGEPTIYQHILNGIIIELKKAGALLSGKINPDEVMKKYRGKEFILVDVVDEKGKKVGQKWWLKKPESIPYLRLIPLEDRIETAVLNVLNRKIKVSFDDILQEIFIQFPNALTPEAQRVKDILSEYALKAEAGRWVLKPAVKTRESQHSGMVYKLGILGKKAGYDVWIGKSEQGYTYGKKKLSELCTHKSPTYKYVSPKNLNRVKQIDVIWSKNKRIVCEFEVEHTTAITEAIVRGSNITDEKVKRFIIIPIEREDFLYRKIEEPILKMHFEKSNWKFIFYDELDKFFIYHKKKKVSLHNLEKLAKMPKKKEPAKQLPLIPQEKSSE